MAKIKKICEVCNAFYDTCPSCEESYSKIYFTWRSHYCSWDCALVGMDKKINGGKKMRIEYNKKSYKLKSWDLDKDTYITTNDIELKSDDISAFILTSEEFKKVVKHAPKKTAPKKKVTDNTEDDAE